MLIVIDKKKKGDILLMVCYWGFLVVVKELIKIEIFINFSYGNYILFIVVCVYGYI